jgi:hypothetical protein
MMELGVALEVLQEEVLEVLQVEVLEVLQVEVLEVLQVEVLEEHLEEVLQQQRLLQLPLKQNQLNNQRALLNSSNRQRPSKSFSNCSGQTSGSFLSGSTLDGETIS